MSLKNIIPQTELFSKKKFRKRHAGKVFKMCEEEGKECNCNCDCNCKDPNKKGLDDLNSILSKMGVPCIRLVSIGGNSGEPNMDGDLLRRILTSHGRKESEAGFITMEDLLSTCAEDRNSSRQEESDDLFGIEIQLLNHIASADKAYPEVLRKARVSAMESIARFERFLSAKDREALYLEVVKEIKIALPNPDITRLLFSSTEMNKVLTIINKRQKYLEYFVECDGTTIVAQGVRLKTVRD